MKSVGRKWFYLVTWCHPERGASEDRHLVAAVSQRAAAIQVARHFEAYGFESQPYDWFVTALSDPNEWGDGSFDIPDERKYVAEAFEALWFDDDTTLVTLTAADLAESA